MTDGIMVIATTVIAFCLGWVSAHEVVAHECEVLGGFYMGSTVYECKVKGETK